MNKARIDLTIVHQGVRVYHAMQTQTIQHPITGNSQDSLEPSKDSACQMLEVYSGLCVLPEPQTTAIISSPQELWTDTGSDHVDGNVMPCGRDCELCTTL